MRKSLSCPENYNQIEDICVRVSPYKLNWYDAQLKCKSEGSSLVNIESANIQSELEGLITLKKQVKPYFEPGIWTTQSQNQYWLGGSVSTLI